MSGGDRIKSPVPFGLGPWIRALRKSMHGSPAELADRCHKAGFRFCAILVLWEDRRVNTADFDDYAGALMDAGIAVHPWGYFAPKKMGPDDFNAVLEGYSEKTGCAPIYNVEKPAKGQRRRCQRLVRDAEGRFDVSSCGFSSYGQAQFHPGIPWDVFTEMWPSNQVYRNGLKAVRNSHASYRKRGFSGPMLPSVPAFGDRAAQKIHDYIAEFVRLDPDIRGGMIWSMRQLSDAELGVCRRWNRMFAEQACLPAAEGAE